MFLCVYMSVCACTHICINILLCVSVGVCGMWLYACVCVGIYAYVHICMYIHMCVYVSVHVCGICVHVYEYSQSCGPILHFFSTYEDLFTSFFLPIEFIRDTNYNTSKSET